MNKYLFIGLLLPAVLITTSVIPSGSETETTTSVEAPEKKTEPVPAQEAQKSVPAASKDIDESDDFFDDFDSFFDVEFPRIEWKKSTHHLVAEKEMVSLPDVDIKMSDDKKALLINIKGLQTKKESIGIDLYEDKGFALIQFPYNEATVTMKLWNDEFALSGVKTITQEKKDEKGKVLSSSSYKGYNSIARSLPRRVHLNSLKKNSPKYNDGVLTLTFDFKESKETISVE
jgi:HSP20 family molecular chaperone IbpA